MEHLGGRLTILIIAPSPMGTTHKTWEHRTLLNVPKFSVIGKSVLVVSGSDTVDRYWTRATIYLAKIMLLK